MALFGRYYSDVKAAHAELVGLYYETVEEDVSKVLSVEEASAIMDGYQWSGGWRISDNDEMTLWNAGCPDLCLFQPPPGYFFVIDTHTMKIYNTEVVGFTLGLEAAQEIDELYP